MLPPPPDVEDWQELVDASHHWPEGQSVVLVVIQYPAPPEEGVYQYWPEGQLVEPPDWDEFQHPPLYQYQPDEAQTAESKQVDGVLQFDDVVDDWQELVEVFQYWPEEQLELGVVEVQYPAPPEGGMYHHWPEGQLPEVFELTQAVPFQY